MKLIWMLAAGLGILSGNVFADQTGMFPNVTESKIDYAAYHALYENQGTSKDLPKIIVFSRAGKCVGIADGKTLTADGITAFITDSLRGDHTACDAVMSNQFGVSELGKNSGTGKPEVVLLVFDNVPFCTACDDFKLTLLRESHSTLANMQLSILSVTLDKKP